MNEQILMKLAEAEKKRSLKQKLKDNAWTIGLSGSAPSVGFAIDQHRRNIKKEKATGEKPKSLIERRPGTVSGAVTGALVKPLTKMVANRILGARTSPAQLASEMVRGAASGAVGGALIVDPLTRWGTRKYYQRRDKEIERAIRNRIQEGSLQKEAACGDTIKNLARRVESRTRNAFQKPRNAKALTTGAIGLGAAGTIAATRAIKNKQQGQEKTASYYAARELLGLQKEASAKDQILQMIRKKK